VGAAAALVLNVGSAAAIVAPVPSVQQVGSQEPLTAARYSLVIDGIEIAAFSELVSLESEIDPGAIAGADRKPASKTSSGNPLPNVTLRRGMTGGMEMWAWHQTAVNGQLAAAQKSVTLIMYNTEGKPIARFFLQRAWPSSVEVSAAKAGASAILYETVTLVGDSLQRVSPS
jgi:phage tail-like protein